MRSPTQRLSHMPASKSGQRPKLSDVARASGVDSSTVSRVLNGDVRARVSPETRARIVSSAQRLGYRANVLARALRTSRSNTLGIVVPQMDNPVFALTISGAERAAWDRGYSLLIAHEHEEPRGRNVFEALVHANQVDGLIVASLDADSRLIPALNDCGVPYVLINRRSRKAANCVCLDGYEASAMAVRHLIELGHRRIAHIAGRKGGFNGPQREQGYKDALIGAGIQPDPRLIVHASYTAEGGAEGMRALLDRAGPAPTAVVAATTIAAAGALAVLHERAVSVPDDMSVIGLHDLPLAGMLYPPLTTVSLPTEGMGQTAASQLIELIENGGQRIDLTLPPLGIMHRGSVAPRRASSKSRRS